MRFNVIGNITSEIGLGVMACDLIQALHDLGHEVVGYDVDPGLNRQGRSQKYQSFLRPASGMYRDGVDLAVFPVSASDHWSRAYCFGKKRVAIPLWELPDINEAWLVDGLQHFEAVVASTKFIYWSLAGYGVDIWQGDHPHYIDDMKSDRVKFGLPDDRVVFTYAFDPSSDLQRKNPQAVFDSFWRADAPHSLLCIQINKSVQAFHALDHWLADLPADRVKVINEHLSHHDAVQLIASSDVYISLHRSEGFGLGMHEAMQLGRPVIATAWSGNMSYMDDGSACLVDADLITLNGEIPAYTENIIGKKSTWADPHTYEAAKWIRELAGDAGLREHIGAAALQAAQEYQAQARKLDWIEKLDGLKRHVRRSATRTF